MSVVEDGEEKKLPLTLSDILVFATGAAHVPPMGWSEQPCIEFKTSCDLPSASTCSNRLYIPTTHWEDYDILNTSSFLQLTVLLDLVKYRCWP